MKIMNIIENIHPLLDPIVRSLIIFGLPSLTLLFVSRYLFPASSFAIISKSIYKRSAVVSNAKRNDEHSAIMRHLLLLIRSTMKTNDNENDMLTRFFAITASVFIATYLTYGFWTGIFGSQYFSVASFLDTSCWMVSLFMAAFPYIFLRVKLHLIRVKNRYALIPAINTFLMKYVEYRGNQYHAMYQTVETLSGEIKHAFKGLLDPLQGKMGSSLDDAIELFIFQIQTSWAIQFGILLHKGEIQGDNIEQGLRWLITDMSEVERITEEVKSENRDNVHLGYLPFIVFPLSIVLNHFPTNGSSWNYYFRTELGIKTVLFTLLYTITCAIIAFLIQKPRNEV